MHSLRHPLVRALVRPRKPQKTYSGPKKNPQSLVTNIKKTHMASNTLAAAAGGGVWKDDWKQVSAEVERRHEIVQTQIKKSKTVDSVESADAWLPLEWRDDQQQHLVVHIAGRGQQPRSDKAGVQLLAAFRTSDQATEYGSKLYAGMPECHVWRVEMCRWFLLCKTTERQSNSAYVLQKIEQLRQLHDKHKQFRQKDFQQNRQQKQKGPLAQSLDQQRMLKRNRRKQRETRASSRLAALREMKQAAASGTPSRTPSGAPSGTPAAASSAGVTSGGEYTGQIPTAFMVRKQNYAVVSWMKDITPEVMRGSDDMEPACIVWRCFDDYPGAKKWLEEVMCKLVRDYDLEIVDLYEWLYPEHVDREKMQEGFRNKQQEQFMLRRKTDKAEVQDFKHWCEEKKVDTPVLDLDAETPAPTGVPQEPLATWQDRAPIPAVAQPMPIKVNAPIFSVGEVATATSPTHKTHNQPLAVSTDPTQTVATMLHQPVAVQPAPKRQPLQ